MNLFAPQNVLALQQCITDSRNGDPMALNQLAEYLLPKAFEIARLKAHKLSPMDDFEDIAISAVKSICIRVQQGQCEFFGEKELDGLLRQFVIGKVRDRKKYHLAGKRNVNLNNDDQGTLAVPAIQNLAIAQVESVWLDEKSVELPLLEQEYLASIVEDLGDNVQGLFAELVKQLDEKPRQVLMMLTSGSVSNTELAEALDCAPSSIERYRRAIRTKLEEIVNQ
ncbi:MAG: ECF-type sigma factor [Pirellulaceae bacterium]